ncbi:hypothetical protein ABZ819_05135 [Streptomyces venezuelae]|uniref:hypothetical protein n=1 Tax=Streptomyces venezuelae TaxID=54571 RepID=UPI0034374510
MADANLIYRTFRFAVDRPARGAAQIRSKMTGEQWAAFVAAVVETDAHGSAD